VTSHPDTTTPPPDPRLSPCTQCGKPGHWSSDDEWFHENFDAALGCRREGTSADVPAGPAPGTSPAEAITAAAEAIHDYELRPEPGKPCWCSEAVEHADQMRMAYERAQVAVAAAAPHMAAAEREACPGGQPYFLDRRFHADGSQCKHRPAAVPGQPQDTAASTCGLQWNGDDHACAREAGHAPGHVCSCGATH